MTSDLTSRTMTRAEAERLGSYVWGHGWQTRLAEALDVQPRTVRRWIAADELPHFAAARLRGIAHIAPPPDTTADDDRDDACADAIEGDLSRLVSLAEDAGWHRAEIQVAILSLTVTDILVHAGRAATLDVLDQARDLAAASP